MPLKKNGGAVEEAFLRVYWQTFRLSTDMSIDIADEVNYVPFYELGLMIILYLWTIQKRFAFTENDTYIQNNE